MQHALKVAARGDVQDLPSIAHQVLLLCSQENTAETLLVRNCGGKMSCSL